MRVSLTGAITADLDQMTGGVIAGQAFQVQSRSSAAGRVTFRASNLAQTLRPGIRNQTLATVRDTNTTNGTTTVDLAVVSFIDAQDQSVTPTIENGQLAVKPATSPFNNPVPGVGTSAVPTDPDGDEKFENIDGDGKAAFEDAIALAFANPSQLNSQQAAALDFDDGGTVDFGDAVALAFE
jgi:hypothetical protein